MEIPKEIEDKMLSIRGSHVNGGMSSYDIERISDENRSFIVDGGKVVVVSGYGAGRCFGNSLDYYLKNSDNVHICTGFATSVGQDDWVAHSWCMDDDDNIYECTGIKRDIYFGYKMNKEEEYHYFNENFFELDEIPKFEDTPFADMSFSKDGETRHI